MNLKKNQFKQKIKMELTSHGLVELTQYYG